ncbi:MAG: tetratricopeptide repeat protein [Bacteroidetes bacterium]|nr:tetratricopeptide repeat protein [Bacteroidota bacterium]
MPQKKDTIKFLLCLLILLSSGYAFSLEAYDDDNIYTGYDYARLDSAIRSTAARYAHYPASTTLIRQLAELYTARSETDSALLYWQRLSSLQPDNDTLPYRQALLLYDDKRYDNAYVAVEKSLALRGDNIDYLTLAASIAYRLHQTDSALAYSQRVLGMDSRNINALLVSGLCLRDLHRYDDALIQFTHCLEADPSNTDALIHRAEIFVLSKNYNSALRDYSAARADLSENAAVINNIGICYYESGSYTEAIALFQKAILLNSQQPESSYNKGITQYKLHQFDAASAALRTAGIVWDSCQSDSCHARYLDAVYYLGMCYKKTGNLDEAKKQFEFLQKEKYNADLTGEIRHIRYALFFSSRWYYILLGVLVAIALIISVIRMLRR